MTHEFWATGTEWWISVETPEQARIAEALVRHAEQKLSRFLPDSSLSALNRCRFTSDRLLVEVVQHAFRWRCLTKGAFDPSMGRHIQALGYDQSFLSLSPQAPQPVGPPTPLAIVVQGTQLQLQGEGDIDLGGIAKGFIVDKVIDMLWAQGGRQAVVDGGGDIRVLGGPWPIELESGHVVDISDAALATSSVCKRRWRDTLGDEHHHILDPHRGISVSAGVDVVTVHAKTAMVADVLATALLVETEAICRLLPSFQAAASLRGADGTWWNTSQWEVLI